MRHLAMLTMERGYVLYSTDADFAFHRPALEKPVQAALSALRRVHETGSGSVDQTGSSSPMPKLDIFSMSSG